MGSCWRWREGDFGCHVSKEEMRHLRGKGPEMDTEWLCKSQEAMKGYLDNPCRKTKQELQFAFFMTKRVGSIDAIVESLYAKGLGVQAKRLEGLARDVEATNDAVLDELETDSDLMRMDVAMASVDARTRIVGFMAELNAEKVAPKPSKSPTHGGPRKHPKPPKSPGRKPLAALPWHEKARRMKSSRTEHKVIAAACRVDIKTLEKFIDRERKPSKKKPVGATRGRNK